jgi:hypothetical protein
VLQKTGYHQGIPRFRLEEKGDNTLRSVWEQRNLEMKDVKFQRTQKKGMRK